MALGVKRGIRMAIFLNRCPILSIPYTHCKAPLNVPTPNAVDRKAILFRWYTINSIAEEYRFTKGSQNEIGCQLKSHVRISR